MSAARTLSELLERAAARGGGGLRFVDRAERDELVGWAALAARAERVAGGLAALGVAPGERVAIFFPTGPDFFAACFGVLRAGAVPVPLAPPVRLGRLGEEPRRAAGMLRAAGARRALADRRVARLLGEALPAAGAEVECATLDGLPGGPPPPVPGDSSALAIVQFSSGTTVAPKPVALSQRAVLAQVELLNGHWRHLPGVSGVSWLPLHHDMGLIGCVFPAVEQAAELTLIPPEVFVAWPAIWLRTLSRVGGVVSAAPNFAYGLCVERIRDEELTGVDLSRWRVALNGAEAVAPGVLRRFCDRFARWGFRREALSPVYGLAEAALAVTFSDLEAPFISGRFARPALARGRAEPDPDGLELVSVGRPLPGCAVEVRDEAGAAVTDGIVGRVWARGPSLMEGYLGQPEATARVLVDGWLDTGDLGFLDGGELYLTGRGKDLVVVRGRNYLPDDLEQAITELPGARAAAAVSHLPEGGEREALVLLVETERGRRGEPTALAAACGERLLARAGLAPDRVVLLPPGALPRTSSGKIRRREALARLLAGELTVLAASWTGSGGDRAGAALAPAGGERD